MANLPTSYLPLPEGQQLAVATMELPRENTDWHTDSPPADKRRHTFGMFEPLSPESEESDIGLPESKRRLYPEPEGESGKRTLYSTRPENDFRMNILSF